MNCLAHGAWSVACLSLGSRGGGWGRRDAQSLRQPSNAADDVVVDGVAQVRCESLDGALAGDERSDSEADKGHLQRHTKHWWYWDQMA